MATKTPTVTTPSGYKVAVPGFQVSTFPPYLSSPVWPTAPIAPAPKFVIMPRNVRFVPEYNWGCPEDMPDPVCPCNWDEDDDDLGDEALFRAELGAYGATEAQKRRARRKSAMLRAKAKKQSGEKRRKLIAKAIAVEKKAGIYKKPKKKSGISGKRPTAKEQAEIAAVKEESDAEALVDSGKVTEPSLPDVEGVPKDAEEGRANMKLIIGGTVALMAAIGIGFAMTQAKKKRAVPAAAPSVPAPVAPAPKAAPVIETPAQMSEGAEEEAPAPVSNPLRPHVLLPGVRTRWPGVRAR